MSLRINDRWVLVLLVVGGQLLLLVPSAIWLVNWIDGASRDVLTQRLNAAVSRHVLQIGGLIEDMGLTDLGVDSPDRARLQNLITRIGRPYGATLVVVGTHDRTLLAWPPPDGGQDPVAEDWTLLESLPPIAVRQLPGLDIELRALPNEADVAVLMAQFNAYVRAIVVALTAIVVIGAMGLTFLIVRRYENRLAGINVDLEEQVEKRGRALIKSRSAVIFGLAMLAESRDGKTGQHLDRIRSYVRLLGDELVKSHPEVNEEFVDTIEETSALHDIGKVGVPDSVLLKPDELTDEQRTIMRKHPLIGFDTMLAVKRRWGDDPFLVTACEICFAHHERWDGEGYPFGLASDSIPLSARIVALADVYDALTTRRVYKEAVPHDHAREYIVRESGKHFDPAIVEAFLQREEAFRRVVESEDHEPGLGLSDRGGAAPSGGSG